MNNNQVNTLDKSGCYTGDHGYKVVEVNISSPSENLYAVCTPIKIK